MHELWDHKNSRMRRSSVENVSGISREINLPATFGKPPSARLASFEVEQTRRQGVRTRDGVRAS